MKSTAPACIALTIVGARPTTEIIAIDKPGISSRIRRKVSMPPIPGIMMSNRTRSAETELSSSIEIASSPLSAQVTA